MFIRRFAPFVFLVVALAAGVRLVGQQGPAPEPADLVLRGGRIVTLDDRRPEAQALAARNGSIVAVGSDAEIGRYVGPATQVIELRGQFAMPGFI